MGAEHKDGRLVTHLDVYQIGNDDPIHSVKLDPSTREFGRKIERVTMGMLMNMRDGCYIDERYEGA